ncbi:hypothetical protein ACH4FX_12055 [Streptomyces sp. NPDC018019]|uniref:hypothetical protein n=1 Tax=Streptomyces sp. NPDC018019 TaxID=3365030 RepID=UPI0037A2E50E
MAEARKYRCPDCHKNITATTADRFRRHDGADGSKCGMSAESIPAHLLQRGPETDNDDRPVKGRDYADCPECDRSPAIGRDGRLAEHRKDPPKPEMCPAGGTPYRAPSEDRKNEQPTEAAELISKWGKAARKIEERKLPPPSPESMPTPPDSPKPQSVRSGLSITATSPTGAGCAGGAGAGESTPLPEIHALAAAFPKKAAAPRRCNITTKHLSHQWLLNRQALSCPGYAPPAAPGEPAPGPASAEAVAAVSEDAPSSTGIHESQTSPAASIHRAASTESATARKLTVGEPPPAVPETLARYEAMPIAAPSPIPDAGPSTAAGPTTPATAPPSRTEFARPGSPFSQPDAAPRVVTEVQPMTLRGEQIAARLKEMFYAYSTRLDRSVQETMGPSDIGTPCDRRIAMSLLRVAPVSPGRDNWASFKGTCIHAGLADMFQWADAGQGRFAVEVPLQFPSERVPKGTADLLDRVLFMVGDHKVQGRRSQDRLRTKGMTPLYRAQLHVYGFGARLRGEQVDYVALISWPMEASTLDDLYVVVERYDPQIARDALARVDGIAAKISDCDHFGANGALKVAATFPVADDCRYCQFHAPGDPDMTRGCPGR